MLVPHQRDSETRLTISAPFIAAAGVATVSPLFRTKFPPLELASASSVAVVVEAKSSPPVSLALSKPCVVLALRLPVLLPVATAPPPAKFPLSSIVPAVSTPPMVPVQAAPSGQQAT